DGGFHRRAQRVALVADADGRRLAFMYSHILVAVEHSAADAPILAHTQALAKLVGSRMTLVHVADGWAARNYDALALRESEEMKDDRAYLDRLGGEIQSKRIAVECTIAPRQ